MSTPFTQLEIPSPLYEAMLAQARAELPNECCGLFAGKIRDGVGWVEVRYPLVNAAADPRLFESDPASMFAAHKDMHRRSLELLAVYHSHPTSAPVPSRTDLERNFSPDVVNLIISLTTVEPCVRGWWLTATDYREAKWTCAEPSQPDRNSSMTSDLISILTRATVYDLEQPRFVGMPIHPAHRPGYFYTLHRRHADTLGLGKGGPRSSASGVLTMMEHTGTHIDALCHQACGLKLFGGVGVEGNETPTGFKVHGVETVPPLVTRGVLLDVAGWKGVQRLPENYSISADELVGCAAAAGVEVRSGDVLLVRTGFGAIWDDEPTYLRASGVGKSGTLWAAERAVKAVGADNMAWDAPEDWDAETGANLFAHVYLLAQKGIYILENLDLETLARDRRYEFGFVAVALKLRGATGSPIRPLALVHNSTESER